MSLILQGKSVIIHRIAKNRKLYSTEKLIKLAGNSIVVDVLEAIFRQIMDINTEILGERE